MASRYHNEDDIEVETDKYRESDDEDFNPDTAPAEEPSSTSEDEDAPTQPAQRKGKRKASADEDLDSGDEVTIKAARTRRAKKPKKGTKNAEEDLVLSDEGGEGGLVKTRAQRKVEKKEARPLARTEGATIDVDALWAQMTAAPIKPVQPTQPKETSESQTQATTAASVSLEEEEQVSIKKTYTFAGQDTTEEKLVPSSQLSTYLSSGWKASSTSTPTLSNTSVPLTTPKANTSRIRRPLHRPTRFDPNPTGYVRALLPAHQLSWPRATTSLHRTEVQLMPPPEVPKARAEKAQKLNVVDKSRMDWTGFVDKEGIGEELDTHGKTKEAYLGRMEFLADVEKRREDERMRVKSVVGTT